jgi:hypothetical protein
MNSYGSIKIDGWGHLWNNGWGSENNSSERESNCKDELHFVRKIGVGYLFDVSNIDLRFGLKAEEILILIWMKYSS